jgi:hypothetical protein
MTAPDDAPDPEREPVRLGDLFPDVIDGLAEVAAAERVHTRHEKEHDHD